MNISALDKDTVKLITTTQIITSVSTVVKELIENALDANARNIEINLTDNGCTLIEVKDDGFGISKEDAPYMALSSYTSKIFSFADLDSLETYGFRGEALYSLSAMSDLTIVSKTEKDKVAMLYSINNHGYVVKSEPCHRTTGTTIQVRQLFKQIPVRRQIITNSKKANQDIKALELLVKCYGICKYPVRISFKVDGNIVFAKPCTASLEEAVAYTLGKKVTSNMNWINVEDAEINMKLMVPSKNPQYVSEVFHSGAQLIFVNNRPIKHKELEKIMIKAILEALEQDSSRKKPIFVLYILTTSTNVDVNLEPNKTSVFFKDQQMILSTVDKHLREFYGIQKEMQEQVHEKSLNGYQDCTEISLNDNETQNEWPACKKRKVQTEGGMEKFILKDKYLPQKSNDNVVQNLNSSNTNSERNRSAEIIVSEQSNEERSANECEGFPKDFNTSLPPLNLSDSESNDSQKHVLVFSDKTVSRNTANEVRNENTDDSPPFELTPGYETLSQLPIVDLGESFDCNDFEGSTEGNGKENKTPNENAQISRKDDNQTKVKACVTLEEWSKGHVSGLKGGTNVLPYTDREPSDSPTSDSYHGNACKGFLKFSKHVTSRVSEENPGMTAPRIAHVITKLWKQLSPEERGYYRDLALDEEIEHNEKKQEKKDKSVGDGSKNKKRLLNVLEKMKTISIEKKENLVMRTTVPWNINIEKVTECYQNNSICKNTKYVVGVVDSKLWVVYKSLHIWIVDTLNLKKGLNICNENIDEDYVEELLNEWFEKKDDLSILYPVHSLTQDENVNSPSDSSSFDTPA